MPNYFDYISECADSSVDVLDDFDDINDVYNEMDATVCEFDSYVQESVGVAIAASVGGAALLGGLIALIAKCFGKTSPSSASRAAKEAKKAAKKAEAAGEEVPDIELPTVEAIEAAGEAVEKELDSVADSFEEVLIVNSGSNGQSENYSELKKGTTSVAVGEPYGDTKKPERKYKKYEANSPYLPIPVSKVESWGDLYKRLDAIEKTSDKISQKQKVLKKTEQKVNKAQQNGAKLAPQQQNALKQKQGKAANHVAKTSSSFMKPINKFFSAVKTKGEKAAKMLSDRLK